MLHLRAKRRLLLIVNDDDGLKRNFQKHKIDINTAMNELGIQKAVIEDWFAIAKQQIG